MEAEHLTNFPFVTVCLTEYHVVCTGAFVENGRVILFATCLSRTQILSYFNSYLFL